MRAENAPRGLVVDAAFRIRPELARWLRDSWCVNGFIRSMPHAGGWRPSWLDVIEADELGELTDDGFGVAGYQIFRSSRQTSAADGAACAQALIAHAETIGLPQDVTLFTDCEAFRASADALGFVKSWAHLMRSFTNTRGSYLGANFKLPNLSAEDDARKQGDALWGLAGINRYWQSMSQVWTPSVRGPCLGQIWEYVLYGSGPGSWRLAEYNRRNFEHEHLPRLDLNRHNIDSLGGRLRWAVK